jgi:hypothetical protein
MSSPFTTSKHSTVSKLKNRFSRASLCTLPNTPVKGILKKQTSHHQQRPASAIIETRQRTSAKKRYTVLSTITSTHRNNHDLTRVKFNKFVDIHETYAKSEYDRSSDMDAVCTRLTAAIATQIKQELNHYKLHEMQVHDSSRIHTHFFL